jgi:hypothetical protein
VPDDEDAAATLAKCLRPDGFAAPDENRVNARLSLKIQSDAASRRWCPPLAPTMRAAASRAVMVFDRTKIR